ncbi:MAG: glutathione synthase [Gammaproteobacteria bacterium]|nr:glutathione synthase [Gammaproteobacteria bacterium]
MAKTTKRPKIAIVMDPIQSVAAYKDTTIGMIWAAQDYADVHYLNLADLWIANGQAMTCSQLLVLHNDQGKGDWYQLGERNTRPASQFDIILMRKDPPFDMEYIYATYILDRAQVSGVTVSNHPQALRDINEKAYTAWFPELCPPTLITRDMQRMVNFQQTHGSVVAKPLDGMGGKSIFVIHPKDGNRQVIFETLTDHGKRFAMVQGFIPEITETGDQRIIIIDGKAAPYALARIPVPGEHRGNLAAGGKGQGVPLSSAAQKIANVVGPELKKRGVLFAGLDVIGNYMTEINVTSPTGIRELNSQFDLDLGRDYVNALLKQIR